MRIFSFSWIIIIALYMPTLYSLTPIEHQHDFAIIMFYKDSCPYSRYMLPIMKEIKNIYQNHLAVVNVNITSHTSFYKNTYHFKTTPTVIYFDHGKEVFRHGSDNKKMTVSQMQNTIKGLWNHLP